MSTTHNTTSQKVTYSIRPADQDSESVKYFLKETQTNPVFHACSGSVWIGCDTRVDAVDSIVISTQDDLQGESSTIVAAVVAMELEH